MQIDQPTTVRAGEALPVAPLETYLREQLGLHAPLRVEQFPGGFSNLTYLLRAGEQEWVLRRPPFGAQVRGGHDMQREFRMLHALHASGQNVPQPLAFCADQAVVGAPFYVMERVRGVILRAPLPERAAPPEAHMRQACHALIETLVDLHALDYTAANLGDLGKPAGYTARQVAGWTGRYANARTDDIPAIEHVATWLAANIPPETAPTLIHNDFKYDNVVFGQSDFGRVIAVLDWEMATLGDPLTDLGTTLAYWMEPNDPAPLRGLGVSTLPGNLDRRQWAARYAERSGRDLSNIVFYFVYGLFKNAVIVQQIYARYRQGLTNDQRFAELLPVVQAYSQLATRAIAHNRLDRLFDA